MKLINYKKFIISYGTVLNEHSNKGKEDFYKIKCFVQILYNIKSQLIIYLFCLIIFYFIKNPMYTLI